MSVEERLRQGLARNAAGIDVPTERRLDAVLRVTRRRVRRRWAWRGVALVAAATVGFSLAPGLLDAGDARRGADIPAVSGPTDGPGVDGTFADGGTLGVVPPTPYAGVLSGALYRADGDRLQVNVFGQDLCSGQGQGSYRWSRTAEGLELFVVEDPCGERAAVLAGGPWQVVR